MKKLVFQMIVILSLTSCSSTYFYSTLDTSSKNTLKDTDGYFITKMDSLDIVHSFKGENAPIMISVFNKSKQPIYVDWNRSAVIIDGIANGYNGSIASIPESNIANTENNLFLSDNSYTNKNIGTSLPIPEGVSFIPPFSRINYQTLSLTNFGFEEIDNKVYQNKKMGDKDGYLSNVKVLDFSISNSPLKFRSYLTLYRDPALALIVDEEFYMSNLIKTKDITPSSMHSSIFDKGNMFYIRVAPNNQIGEILLGGTLLVGVVLLDASLSKSTQDGCSY